MRPLGTTRLGGRAEFPAFIAWVLLMAALDATLEVLGPDSSLWRLAVGFSSGVAARVIVWVVYA